MCKKGPRHISLIGVSVEEQEEHRFLLLPRGLNGKKKLAGVRFLPS